MKERRLTYIHARAGDAYDSIRRGDVAPRVDAVIVYGPAEWLSGGPLIKTHLTPHKARKLAIELLLSAQAIESREVVPSG